MKLLNQSRVARPLLVIALIFATVTFNACSDDQLKTIATNVDRVALLIKDGREIRDELQEYGLIDQAEARKISQGLLKVNSALKAFNAQAKAYAAAGSITPEGKTNLKNLAIAIAEAARELVLDGTFGVKNPNAQAQITAAIGAIKQVTLTIVDTVSLIKTKGAQ